MFDYAPFHRRRPRQRGLQGAAPGAPTPAIAASSSTRGPAAAHGLRVRPPSSGYGHARHGHRPAAEAPGAPSRRHLPDGLSLPLRRRRVRPSPTRAASPASQSRGRCATSAGHSGARRPRSSRGFQGFSLACGLRPLKTSATRSSRPAMRMRAGSSSGTPRGVYPLAGGASQILRDASRVPQTFPQGW